jgi:hypothetical protein
MVQQQQNRGIEQRMSFIVSTVSLPVGRIAVAGFVAPPRLDAPLPT